MRRKNFVAKIEIYTSPFCGFCARAKSLLDGKGVAFEEIDTFMTGGARQEMAERSGGRTSVPQVFVDDEYIGDCEGIFALDAAGELDAKLGVAG
jgi:glutaredoxin 3